MLGDSGNRGAVGAEMRDVVNVRVSIIPGFHHSVAVVRESQT